MSQYKLRIRSTCLSSVLLLVATLACASAQAATSKGFHFAKIGTGFPEALYVTSAPNDASTLYVVEQSGRIVMSRGGVPAGTFLDIHSEVRDDGEQGLVGFVFSPAYASDHTFYVDYVATDGDTHISKFTADQGVAVPTSEQQLLDVQQPFVNHKGGMLAFDKRGRLWAGLGDGGTDDTATYADQVGRAQNMNVLLGKLLHLDTRTPGATWQIAALGVRNPYRFSFDRQTGDLWLVDPGTHLFEEIDFRTAAQLDTLWNFGWSRFEGPIVYDPHMALTVGTLVKPWYSFRWGKFGACATIGGYVYRGKNVPAARGRYFFGDYCTGWIQSLKRNAKGRPVDLERSNGIAEQLTSFGEDANGELYAVTATGDLWGRAARRLALRVLQRRLFFLRLRQRQRTVTDLRVQLVLDPIDLCRARVRLRPEIARVGRIAANLEADQVILLVRRRRAVQSVRAHLRQLQLVRVVDRRTNRRRPAAYADGRADRRLRDVRVENARHARQHAPGRGRGTMKAQRERKDEQRDRREHEHVADGHAADGTARASFVARCTCRQVPASAHTTYATHGSPMTSV